MNKTTIGLGLATALALTGCANINTQTALEAGVGVLQATTLDESQVVQMSALAAKEMDSKSKLAPDNSSYSKRLAKLTQGVASQSGLDLNFKVYLAPEINAFAMADGTVRVFSGLMDAMPDDQVQAVLLHEIGHVKLKHSYKQIREKLLTDSAFKAVSSVGGTLGDLTSSQLGQIGQAYLNARYSQADELEADAFAVKSLHKLGQDPYAMQRSIATLQQKYGSGGGFLSSHPSNEIRLAKIEEAIKKLK